MCSFAFGVKQTCTVPGRAGKVLVAWHGPQLWSLTTVLHQEACMAADDEVVLELLLHTSLNWSPLHLLAWLPLMEQICELSQVVHLKTAAACAI